MPIHLNTSGNGEGMQYYDQVCALSQETINKNFIKLFELRPEVSEMIWIGKDSSEGELRATLLPPQVEISLESSADPEINFQLRIATGNIFFGRTKVQNVDNWVITVSAKLADLVVSVDPAIQTTQKALDNAALQLEEIEQLVEFRFDKPTKLTPGEYSIHRLFASIASNKWGSPLWDRSYFTLPNGQRVSLRDWTQDPANNLMFSDVQRTLSRWAIANQYGSIFTLGLQLRVPRSEVANRDVTFAPRALHIQSYPYISEARQRELTAAGLALTGLIGSPYNCFTYCEVVGRRMVLPATRVLPFSANLAKPVAGSQEEVVGTFVLDYRLFLEQHLLPQLQELCVATQIIPLWPKMVVENWHPAFQTRFASGTNPEDEADRVGLPLQVATDPSFAFKKVGPQKYEWTTSRDAPGSGSFVVEYGPNNMAPIWRRYKTSSQTTVTITWTPGGDQFNVSGRCVYKHWEGYSQKTRDFGWPDANDNVDHKSWWSIFRDIATWSFIVDLHVPQASADDPNLPNGIIEPKLLGCVIEKDPTTGLDNVVPANLEAKVDMMQYVLSDHHVLVQKAMKKSIGLGLGRVNRNLQNNFRGIGGFTYPGSGELAFGPPTIDELGNIIASIDYLPPRDGRVTWAPPTPVDLEVPLVLQGDEYLSDPSVTRDLSHLHWTVVAQYDRPKQQVKLSITAKNLTNSTIAFKSLKAIMLRMKRMDHKRLYNASWDVWAELETESDAITDDGETGGKVEKKIEKGGKEETEEEVEEVTEEEVYKKMVRAEEAEAEPTPTETWSISADLIAQELITRPRLTDRDFQFNTTAKVLEVDDEGEERPDRFIMPIDASVTLELSGTTYTKDRAGIYVVQLNEVWASPKTSGRQIIGRADTFLVVELTGFGAAETRFVTMEEADALRAADAT